MCCKIYANAWHEKLKTASVKARAGHKGAEEGGEGTSTWEVASPSSRTGPLIQLCSSSMKRQGSYAGKANPARKGMGSHTPGAKQACPCNLREELKSGFDC